VVLFARKSLPPLPLNCRRSASLWAAAPRKGEAPAERGNTAAIVPKHPSVRTARSLEPETVRRRQILHPRCQITAETLYNATPIERWCWFFCHVQELTTEQVSLLLPEQEFTEAARVLDMIAQTPEQLYEYNARLKAQRDEEARIIYAQQQGIEIGEARGIRRGLLQGQILLLQQMLKLPTCTDEQFAACDINHLTQMLTQLQQQFKDQVP
jgi:hypothetical protein